MLETLRMYCSFPFVRYALVVGVLVSICTSLFGVSLVLKRLSFMGDCLSHVAFGSMAMATVLKMSNHMPLTLFFTAFCALLLLCSKRRNRFQNDSVLATISVGALALGYLLMNLFAKTANISGDVCSTLFGSTSILTLTLQDVWLSISLALVILVFFILFYHRIFSITFDEEFAYATGSNVNISQSIMAIIIAVMIVLAMNLVGALLTTALIVIPALAAICICKSFRMVVLCACVFSALCTLLGIGISILMGTPVGATIVSVDILGYAIFRVAAMIKGD